MVIHLAESPLAVTWLTVYRWPQYGQQVPWPGGAFRTNLVFFWRKSKINRLLTIKVWILFHFRELPDTTEVREGVDDAGNQYFEDLT